jgi:hypothetical protein
MTEITELPLGREAYHKALQLNLTLWNNYKTGEVFIQRWFWRNLPSDQKLHIINELEGLIDNDCPYTR